MDFIALLPAVYNMLMNIPVVGHVLTVIVGVVMFLPPVLTALVALWHALVLVFKALGAIPGLSFLTGIANFFSANEPAFQGFLTKVIDWIALIPVPKKPEAK